MLTKLNWFLAIVLAFEVASIIATDAKPQTKRPAPVVQYCADPTVQFYRPCSEIDRYEYI